MSDLADFFFGEEMPEGTEHRDENGCVWRYENGQWVMLYIITPDPNGAHGL